MATGSLCRMVRAESRLTVDHSAGGAAPTTMPSTTRAGLAACAAPVGGAAAPPAETPAVSAPRAVSVLAARSARAWVRGCAATCASRSRSSAATFPWTATSSRRGGAGAR
jgi:hypothetical protein